MKTRITRVFLPMIVLLVLTGCDSSKSRTPSGSSAQSLTIGVLAGDLSSLFFVADDQGYFADHNLTANMKLYESGVRAMNDLLAGNVDLATAADFVAARHMFERPDLRIIASLCETSDNVKLVARKDHGITRISDIRHKRIGLVRGSVAEFFLDLLLVVHNIPVVEVQKVDLSPSDQAEAISKGEVDGVVVWEPFATSIGNKLGADALRWSAQTGQSYHWLLLGTEDTLKKRSSAVQDLLSSLISAEEFLRKRKDEAKIIVARKLGLNDFSLFRKNIFFEVCLDHPLILTMEVQMRWMKPGIATHPSDAPDLLKLMYFDALKSVQPERIKMIIR